MKILNLKSGRYSWLSYILFIAFLLTFVQCNEPDKKKSESTKTTTEQKTTADKKVEKEKPKLFYDDKGNLTERQAYSYRKKDGSIRAKESYYYEHDDRGNVTKEVKESYSPDGKILSYKNVNIYSYDINNNRTEQVFSSYDTDGNLKRKARHTFKFNKYNRMIEDLGYFDDGSIQSKIIFEPDSSGKMLSEEYIHYLEDGTIKDHMKYYYSDYGLEKTVDLMKNK